MRKILECRYPHMLPLIIKPLLLLIVFIIFVGAARIAFELVIKRLGEKLFRPEDSYERRPGLFTQGERAFLVALDETAGQTYRVFGKVRLADLVEAKKKFSWKSFNRISGIHLDFVLCNKDDLSVACVVELDDHSHDRPDRQARDAFVDQVLQGAGIPIIHLPALAQYNVSTLRSHLAQKLPALATSCPECKATMVIRRVAGGPDAGKKFWGCSRYPACPGTREI